jgi:hypothetical protein
MLQKTQIVLFAAMFMSMSSGCHSHQAKVAELQKEYDRLNQQFGKDCASELLEVPPTLSEKCSAEDKQVKGAWDRLQAERAKN